MKPVKRMSTFIAVMMLMGLLFIPASSYASIPIHFWDGGLGNFDELKATATDPIFAVPGFSDFTDAVYNPLADWYSTYISPNVISASGGSRGEIIFTIAFDDAFAATPFSFEFYAFNNGAMIEWSTVSYNGQGLVDWQYDNWSFELHPLNTVPEPSTVLLLTCGLAALAIFARRNL